MPKTRDEINALLRSNDRACEVGVYRIYQLQTEDEKQSDSTKHDNGVGFAARDAEFGSSLARQVEQNRMIGKGRRTLSSKQLAGARKLCLRYSRQLTAIANGELSVPPAPWEAKPEPREPEPGTVAYTARILSQTLGHPEDNPDFWDDWKHDMYDAM
jgi:hypothetical protein